jgi:transposase
VAQSLRLSQGAVHGYYMARARRAGLGWPLPDGIDDIQLEALLFPPPSSVTAEQRPVPDWAVVHRELRRPNVTLSLLWEEGWVQAAARISPYICDRRFKRAR